MLLYAGVWVMVLVVGVLLTEQRTRMPSQGRGPGTIAWARFNQVSTVLTIAMIAAVVSLAPR